MELNVKNRTIFEGDNLDILRGINSDAVDLIYLDPPFNSNRTYSAPIGSEAAGASFKDAWTLDDVDEAWHGEIAEREPALYRVIDSSELSHGKGMKSYLMFMAVRLLEMKRILKNTGSVYLHCDSTASHYLKLIMDSIFDITNFRNEIIWQRTSLRKGGTTKGVPNNADCILRYSKTEKFVWNSDAVIIPYDLNNLPLKTKKKYNKKDETGRLYYLTPITVPAHDQSADRTYELMGITRTWRWGKERMEKEILDGRIIQTKPGAIPRYKSYLDEQKGLVLNNIWTDITHINSQAKERTGYPTQKPLALLERIIKASSNVGDVVLDPFCGCATTCVASETLGREWVGIDLSELAVKLVNQRLRDHHGLFGQAIHRKDTPVRTDLGKLPNYRTHKHTLYGRQEGLCNGCGVQFPFRNMTIDHVVPQVKGGSDHIDNLQLLCGACNSTKGGNEHSYLVARLKEQGVIDWTGEIKR